MRLAQAVESLGRTSRRKSALLDLVDDGALTNRRKSVTLFDAHAPLLDAVNMLGLQANTTICTRCGHQWEDGNDAPVQKFCNRKNACWRQIIN